MQRIYYQKLQNDQVPGVSDHYVYLHFFLE